MKIPSKGLACLLTASLSCFASSALAAPIAAPPSSWHKAATNSVQNVRWRGRHWPGAGIGFAAGALIGGALAASGAYGYGYAPGYAYGPAYAPGYPYDYAPGYGYAPSYAPGCDYAPECDSFNAESQR